MLIKNTKTSRRSDRTMAFRRGRSTYSIHSAISTFVFWTNIYIGTLIYDMASPRRSLNIQRNGNNRDIQCPNVLRVIDVDKPTRVPPSTTNSASLEILREKRTRKLVVLSSEPIDNGLTRYAYSNNNSNEFDYFSRRSIFRVTKNVSAVACTVRVPKIDARVTLAALLGVGDQFALKAPSRAADVRSVCDPKRRVIR